MLDGENDKEKAGRRDRNREIYGERGQKTVSSNYGVRYVG